MPRPSHGRPMPRSQRIAPAPQWRDPNRSRPPPDLLPMILDDRGVLKRQSRLASFCRQLDIDPAHRAAEFPRRRKMGRRRARRDGSACISHELVLYAEPQVSHDRQEPARNALKPRQRHRTGRFPVLLEIPHRARNQPQYSCDVDLHGACSPSFRARMNIGPT